MNYFHVEETDLTGLKQVTAFFAADSRGYFLKFFEKSQLELCGISMDIAEGFVTCSAKGTVRGLHFQRCHSQDKLVQVLNGAVYDVAVDLREGSPTFGQWRGFLLSSENRQLLYIPKGFAHGFLALEDNTLFSYLCGDRYDPQTDGGIRWNDPTLAIDWPLEPGQQLVLSPKDAALPTLEEFLREHGGLR